MGIAAIMIGLPRKLCGSESRGRRPSVTSIYVVVEGGSLRARLMRVQICAKSASCLEILDLRPKLAKVWRCCISAGVKCRTRCDVGPLGSQSSQGIGSLGLNTKVWSKSVGVCTAHG